MTTPPANVVPFEIPENAMSRLFSDPEEQTRFLQAVSAAVDANTRAVRETRGWRSCAFEFTRRLRWLPKLRDLSKDQAAEVVNVALGIIFEQDKEEFLWEKVIGDTDSRGEQCDPFSDFLVCWEKLTERTGSLDQAMRAITDDPRAAEAFLGDRFQGVKWDGFRQLLALAHQLQRQSGEGVIFLGVEPVSLLLGVSGNQISRWRQLAVSYGYLETVTEPGPGRATEFRFHREPENQTSTT